MAGRPGRAQSLGSTQHLFCGRECAQVSLEETPERLSLQYLHLVEVGQTGVRVWDILFGP